MLRKQQLELRSQRRALPRVHPASCSVYWLCRCSWTLSLLHGLAVVSNESHPVSCSLDKLLDSGLYTGEITELSGGPGSGKSQVSLPCLPSPSLIIPAPLISLFLSCRRRLWLNLVESADLNCSMNAHHVLQVCFGVAVHISHHLKQSVIFIDTTGGLTAKRLLQMLQAETGNTEEQVSGEERCVT